MRPASRQDRLIVLNELFRADPTVLPLLRVARMGADVPEMLPDVPPAHDEEKAADLF